MIARYTLHFVTSVKLCLFHTLSRSRPNAAEANYIRAVSSLSRLQLFSMVLPRYLKVVATTSGVPLSKIVGAVYGVPGAG